MYNQYDTMAAGAALLGQALFWGMIALLLACPICSAIVAWNKGRDVIWWALLGLFFGPFGLIAAAGIPAIDRQADRARRGAPSRKKICPACYEAMWNEATVCPHCQTEFEPD